MRGQDAMEHVEADVVSGVPKMRRIVHRWPAGVPGHGPAFWDNQLIFGAGQTVEQK
jgi:hypothetical protein